MTDVVVDLETGEITEPEPVEELDAEPGVEPEEDDEQDDHDEEPAAGDEQLRQAALQKAAQTEREVAQKNKQLDAERKRHAGRVVDIMGGDAEALYLCPLCLPLIPGFIDGRPIVGEQKAAVKDAIGEPAEPELQPDSYSNPCDKCGGFGSVGTGSKVVGQAKVTCVDCKGRGWLPRGPERQDGSVIALSAVPPPIDYTQPAPDAPDPPEVAALKQQGYIVVAPIPAPAS